MDETVTVGNAFDGYKYFTKKEWGNFEDSQKRKIVEFKGTIPIDKLIGSGFATAEVVSDFNKKFGINEIVFVAQFALSADGKSFELKYAGVQADINKFEDSVNNGLLYLKDIYTNTADSFAGTVFFLATVYSIQ